MLLIKIGMKYGITPYYITHLRRVRDYKTFSRVRDCAETFFMIKPKIGVLEGLSQSRQKCLSNVG